MGIGVELLQELEAEDKTVVAEALGLSGKGKRDQEQDWEVRQPPWPDPLAEEAYHGLAGDIVKAIEPHTEADPVALLAQFLVAFGNIIGRSAHFVAEADRHYTNLFVALVGTTAKGRKGTSWSHVRRIFATIDPRWSIKTGLSSGEGLIWAVRDPPEDDEDAEDAGVKDKRLLVYEPEFASTLRVLRRDGNTLSSVIRECWDTGFLSILTKNCPAVATDAHISIICHITKAELVKELTSTEVANGFANRFLWLCVKRSKVLPEGGEIWRVNFALLLKRLKEAVEFSSTVGELKRDEEARELWRKVYPALSEGRPGLLGAVIARAEAQVMRLACLYALLDCSRAVRREHLEAALAVWDYAEASARFIFGEALGDPVADRILEALRQAPEGLTRTDISNLFGRNQSAKRIVYALETLLGTNLARVEKETDVKGGRPTERWFAT